MTLAKILTSIRKSYQLVNNGDESRFKIKYQLFKTLLRLHLKDNGVSASNESVTENLFGFDISACAYDDLIAQFNEIALKRQYMPSARKRSLKIIDCGANIGMTVLFFKYFFPTSMILAFEPHPQTSSLLNRNIKSNKVRNVKTFTACLSATNGSINFYPNKSLPYSSILRQPGSAEPITVPAMKLSDFLLKENYDLVKIDAEGAESEILDDLMQTNTIDRASQYLIAFHHGNKDGYMARVIDEFSSRGFQHTMRHAHYGQKDVTSDILISFEKIA